VQYHSDKYLALALSESYIVAVTTKGYVRVYTLFGTPFRVYRQKSQAVTCAAWRDYIMTIGNGSVSADGRYATLHYTVENVKRDEICQNEDVVALPPGAQLQSVFFTDSGVCPLLPTYTSSLQTMNNKTNK
jgi:chromosome transmission fidelity protein 4